MYNTARMKIKVKLGIYCALLWIIAFGMFIAGLLLISVHNLVSITALFHFLAGLGIGVVIVGIDVFRKIRSSKMDFHFNRREIHQSFPIIGFLLVVYGYFTRDELLLVTTGSLLLSLATHLSILMFLGLADNSFEA